LTVFGHILTGLGRFNGCFIQNDYKTSKIFRLPPAQVKNPCFAGKSRLVLMDLSCLVSNSAVSRRQTLQPAGNKKSFLISWSPQESLDDFKSRG
jgi:hypothetical protein